MDTKQKKVFLNRYRILLAEIEQKSCELKQLSAILNLTEFNSVIKLKQLLNTEINSLFALKTKIESSVNNLKSKTEQLIVRFYFINGLKTYEIAEKLNYSERQIQRLLSSAIDNIDGDGFDGKQ